MPQNPTTLKGIEQGRAKYAFEAVKGISQTNKKELKESYKPATVCECVCACACVHACVHACACACVCAHMYVYVHTCMYVCVHTCVRKWLQLRMNKEDSSCAHTEIL